MNPNGRTITQWVATEPDTHPETGVFWPLYAETLSEARAEYARDASMHGLPSSDQVTFWCRESTIIEHTWTQIEGD